MKKDRAVILESWRFTGLSAFARELTHLLEHSDYHIEAFVRPTELEQLSAELEMIRAIGRLKVRVYSAAQTIDMETLESCG